MRKIVNNKLFFKKILILTFLSLLISCKENSSKNESSNISSKTVTIYNPTVPRTFEGIYLGMSESELPNVIKIVDFFTHEDGTYRKDENKFRSEIECSFYDKTIKNPQNHILDVQTIKCYEGKVVEIVLYNNYSTLWDVLTRENNDIVLKNLKEKYPLSGEYPEYSDGKTRVKYVGYGRGINATSRYPQVVYTDEKYLKKIKKIKEDKENEHINNINNKSSIL